MGLLRFFLHRLRRLRQKFTDLYSTSGSFWRAGFYVAKFVFAKIPFLVEHFREICRAKHFQSEIRHKRNLSPNTALLAIKLSGGIGDYLVAARFIRDLTAQSGRFNFDIYCNNADIAVWAFREFSGFCDVYSEFLFNRAVDNYDCGLWTSQFVITYLPRASSRNMSQINPGLGKSIKRITEFRPKIATYVDHHPFMDDGLARHAESLSCRRANYMHAIAGVHYGGDRLAVSSDDDLMRQLGLKPQRYITVHNGFDPAFIITRKIATKCYPHFSGVVEILKRTLSDIAFVQIGTTTSTPIDNVDIDLVGRTSIVQAAALIKNSLMHIDNESGLVHLARCFGVRCCVVFGPTPIGYFGYPDNINIAPRICGRCWWMNETWMDECPRGYHEARCMVQQDPKDVASAILDALANVQVSDERPSIAPAMTAEALSRA